MPNPNHPNAPVGETANCWNCLGSGRALMSPEANEDCRTCGGSGLVPAWVYAINNE